MGLSSQQVSSFIPLDTWTPVILIPGNKPNNNGTYLVSTHEKYLKRCEDMYSMALHSYTFEKVITYQFMGFVAVEIKGLWCRGRMLSYNDFLVKNTVVELIDSRSIVKKQLCDLYHLPDNYKYDPLCLSIKPVDKMSLPEVGQLYVQPLLLLSELHLGYVMVNIKPIDIMNGIHSDMSFKKIDLERIPPSLAINTEATCTLKESECSMQSNLVIQKQSTDDMNEQNTDDMYEQNTDDLLNYVEKQDFEIKVVNISDNLKETFDRENINFIKTCLDNKNTYCLNNISITPNSDIPKCLYLNYVNNYPINNETNHLVFESNDIEYDKSNVDAAPIKDSCIKDSKTSEQCLFKNGSLVEFCYGKNIDCIYIKSYVAKQKYFNKMEQFYTHYKNKNNLKVKTNITNGDMVAASLINYKEIHRAVVLDKNIKNNFNHLHLCFFVDIGCKKYINSKFIYNLFEEAKHVPYLAYKVKLKNMPFNNTLQLKYMNNYFEKLYLKTLIIEFDEHDPNGLNNVILKNKLTNINIYTEIKEFIQKNLKDFKSSNNKGIESEISDYLSYNDLLINGTRVLITHFDSIDQMYVRINTPELIKYYNKIISVVHEFFKNFKDTGYKKTPRIGKKVAVKSSSKNKISRAVITKKIDEMTYLVHYIDYGDTEYVKITNIFMLPYRFRQFPKSVYKIGLNGEFPENIRDYFNQLIKFSVSLIAEFDDDDPLGFQKVILKKESNGVNIFEDIFHQYNK